MLEGVVIRNNGPRLLGDPVYLYMYDKRRKQRQTVDVTGRLAQLVERRTREHNVSGLYRCGFESPAGQLKLLIVFRMRR